SIIDDCWKALKFGSFLCENVGFELISESKKTVQLEEQEVSARNAGRCLVPVVKRLRLSATTKAKNVENETSYINESIQKEILDIRKEIENLSKTRREDTNEGRGAEENKEKSQLKSEAEKILKENEMLKGHVERNDSLTNALQKGLDSSLQINRMLENQIQVLTEKLSKAENVCLETSEKNSKLEQELAISKNSAANVGGPNDIQDLKERLSETEKHKLPRHIDSNLQSRIQHLTDKLSEVDGDLFQSRNSSASVEASQRSEIQDLMMLLSKTEKRNHELVEKNLKLERDIVDLECKAATADANLQSRIQHLTEKLSEAERDLLQSKNSSELVESSHRSEIEDLVNRLSETEKCNHDLYNTNAKLERDLVDSIHNAVTAETNLQTRIQHLTEKLSEAERDLFQSNNNSATIQAFQSSEIQDLMIRLSETEKCNHDLYNKNAKLERDLVDSIHNAVTAETNLQSRIQDLSEKLYGAENEKRELSEEIQKLEVESIKGNHLKEELCSLKDLFNAAKAELQKQIVICETSAIDAKKTESELMTKNETLEEELKGWRKKWSEFESVKAQNKPEHELVLKGNAKASDTNTEENQDGSQDKVVCDILQPTRRRQHTKNTENLTGRLIMTRKKTRLE
ncbi:hypothetical protein Bhyg_12285, partial [Pseudolycoriella hygida]